jgi:preprotein translocase subunit YajC
MSSLLATLAADDNGGGGGGALSILFLVAIAFGGYFLLVRPQRKRQRQAMAMQSSLAEGDEVITTSGMYGFITGIDGDIVWLEIDDDVQIRVARQAVARKVDTSAPAEAPAADVADDSDDDE